MTKEGLNIPAWAVASFTAVILSLIGGSVVWGMVRQDVSNLKAEMEPLKAVYVSIGEIKNDMSYIKEDVRLLKKRIIGGH